MITNFRPLHCKCHLLCISVLYVLAALPLISLTKPFSPRWNDMRVKHSWNAVPKNWESLGHPPSNTTIDLYVALKPLHKNALIDALYEDSSPDHPKHVIQCSFAHASIHMNHLYGVDMVHTFRKSRWLNSLPLIQSRSSISIPGSNTTAYPSRRSP